MTARTLLIAASALAMATAAAAAPANSLPTDVDQELAAAKSAMMTEPQQAYAHAQAAAAQLGRRPAGPGHDLALSTADWLRGEALTRLKRPEQALPILEEAFRSVQSRAPRSKLAGDILKAHGHAEATVGRVQVALRNYQDAYTIYLRAGELRSEAVVLQMIGSIYSDAHDYPHVIQYYAQSEESFSKDPALTLTAENNRGFALKGMGRLGDAEAEFRKALDAARQVHSGYLQADILTNIAFTQAEEGHRAAARASADKGLALTAHDPEAKSERPFLLGVLAKLSADAGDDATAARLLDQVFAGADLDRTPIGFRDFHEVAAGVYEKTGDRGKALAHLKAFKRLDDEARALAASTNAALMGAKFDFANQTAKIAQLKAGELKRDIMLARSKARFDTILTLLMLASGLAVTGLISHAFFTMRRSRNSIRAVNRELEGANGALEKALKAKTEFLATTSHEIRTPLNGMLGMTQVMLADRTLAGETHERLRLLKSAGDTMSALVNDLLDVAKIETGHLSVSRTEIDLKVLLTDAGRMWADKAHTKNLEFVADLSACPGRVVEDGDRLRQVVFNLMSNAIKFTDAGRVAMIASVDRTAEGEALRIDVRDTGIGIPQDQFARIFEPFTQVDGGTSRQHGGTGLGLTICRNLVTALGGRIEVESVVGAGSCFTVRLPLVRVERAIAEATGGSTLGAASILLIEDNPLALSMMRAVLAPHVRRLDVLSSLEAAESATAPVYSRVVVDGSYAARRSPDDPVALIARVAARLGAPVTVLWPSLTPDQSARLTAAGADQVIGKPVTPADLIAALDAACAEAATEQRRELADAA